MIGAGLTRPPPRSLRRRGAEPVRHAPLHAILAPDAAHILCGPRGVSRDGSWESPHAIRLEVLRIRQTYILMRESGAELKQFVTSRGAGAG